MARGRRLELTGPYEPAPKENTEHVTSPATTSSTTSPWRLVVVGTVALLAVLIGVAAGSFLLTTRAATLGAGSAYVPASAPLYLEWRVEPSASQDAALRELIGRFPPIEGIDLERPLAEQMAERLDDLLAGEDAGITWTDDVEPWFDGHVGLAVLDIPFDELAADPTGEAAPSVVILLGVTDPAEARAALDRIVAAGDAGPLEEQVHDGVTIRSDPEEGAFAVTDDQLLVAEGPDDIIAALDARSSGGSTLAETEEITRLTDRLPDDWLMFGVYDLTDVMRVAMEQAESEAPGTTDAFGALLDSQPMRGAFAVTAAGDRLALDAVSEPPSGELALDNADRGLAAEVPADALYYAEGGNIGASLAAVVEAMKAAAASTPEGEEQVATFEAALGADLEEMVSWIEDGAMVAGYDGEAPYAGLVLVPNDPAAAERRLGQLLSFAALAALDPESGIAVSEETIAGTQVSTVRWMAADGGMDELLPMSPAVTIQVAVTDDRAIIGVGEGFVARVLELDAADSLASVDRFTDAIVGLGGPSNAGMGWMDLAGIRAALESAFEAEIGMFDTEGMYESEIRPWLLPLDRAVSMSRLEDGVLVQRSALLVGE